MTSVDCGADFPSLLRGGAVAEVICFIAWFLILIVTRRLYDAAVLKEMIARAESAFQKRRSSENAEAFELQFEY